MEEDLRHYVHLLERGYTPEDALLVTATKFPDFEHESTAPNLTVQSLKGPTEETVEAPYNPYAPSPDVPQPLEELKTKGKKALDYVQAKVNGIDVQGLRPSRRTTTITAGVVGVALVVVLLMVLANQGGAAVEGTWMNDQGQRFVFREDSTAVWEQDNSAQWSQSGEDLVVLANHQGTAFTHTLQVHISEDGRAMWWLPTSIQDNEGEEYTVAPGYNPSCAMLIKSELATTLDKYYVHGDAYEDETPDWCELENE